MFVFSMSLPVYFEIKFYFKMPYNVINFSLNANMLASRYATFLFTEKARGLTASATTTCSVNRKYCRSTESNYSELL